MQERKSRVKNAFPSYLGNEIEAIYKQLSLESLVDYEAGTYTVSINKEVIEIPYRVYLAEPDYTHYTPIQQRILDCYYTRHYNGFIREKHLKRIIKDNYEFVVPYVVQLLGEYVLEILYVIYHALEHLDINLYKQFILDNIGFYKLTKQRVISYYDCYHRWIYKYKQDYVGFKIVKYIDTVIFNQ